jgi:hypothetical protein
MNHRRQRLAYESLLTDGAQDDDAPVVPAAEVVALVERRGPEIERLKTLDRVMRTSDGRRTYELLQAAAFAVRPAPSVERRYAIPLALAALLVLGAAGGGFFMMRTRGVSEAMMSARADVLVLTTPAANAEVLDEATFGWRSVNGASGYDLEILDDQNIVVLSRSLGSNTISIALRDHLRPGVTYQWRVSALRQTDSLVSRPRKLRLSER